MQKYQKEIYSLSDKATHNVGPDIADSITEMPSLSILDDGNQFILDCITTVEEMNQIADEWKNLERACGEPYIYFQSYDWCLKWCARFVENPQSDTDQFQPGIKLHLLRRNGRAVMIWPMMLVKSATGLVTQTFLSEPHGQYGNIICNRKLVPEEIGKRIWLHIKKNTKADVIILDQYPQSSFLKKIIQHDGIVESSDKHSSALDLTAFDTWEEYFGTQSRNMRKQRKQRRNKLSKLGILGYETHYGGTQRFAELVKLGLEWKNLWLNKTGRRAAVLSDERTLELLSSLSGQPGTEHQSPTGAIIGVLTLDDRPIALEIGLAEAGRFYSYLGAFNWEYKNYSPGKLQIEETQKWAKAVGFETFDFLGDPADYKSSWTNTTDALESRSVALTIRGFLYCVFWKAYIRPTVRSLFNKMKPEHRSKLLNLLGIGETKSSTIKNASLHDGTRAANATNSISTDK